MTGFRGIILLFYIIIRGLYRKCLLCESERHKAVVPSRCRHHLPADAGEAVSWKPMQQMFLTDPALDRSFRNTALTSAVLLQPQGTGGALP